MISTLLMSLISIFFDLLAFLRTSKSEKDLEILILRQQVRILHRKTKTPPRISDPERMVLAILLDKYCKFKTGARQHLNQVMLIFHIKGSVRDFLFQFQDENRTEIQYGGEISWEVSSTITKDSLLLRFIPMVRIFLHLTGINSISLQDIYSRLPGYSLLTWSGAREKVDFGIFDGKISQIFMVN